jgi:hypothetical protein
VITIGIAAWAVAFVGTFAFQPVLARAGYEWVPWSCLAGVGVGLLGLWYTKRNRDEIVERTRNHDHDHDHDQGPNQGPGHDHDPGPVGGGAAEHPPAAETQVTRPSAGYPATAPLAGPPRGVAPLSRDNPTLHGEVLFPDPPTAPLPPSFPTGSEPPR